MVFLNPGFIFKYAVSFVLYVRGRGMHNALFFFFTLVCKTMYCTFYVLLVRKINFFFCFPFTNELCSLLGGGEGSAPAVGNRPSGGGRKRKEKEATGTCPRSGSRRLLLRSPAPRYRFPSVLAALPPFFGGERGGSWLFSASPPKAGSGDAFVPLGRALAALDVSQLPCRDGERGRSAPEPWQGLACRFFKGKRERNRNTLNSWRQE